MSDKVEQEQAKPQAVQMRAWGRGAGLDAVMLQCCSSSTAVRFVRAAAGGCLVRC
jgi:hypothetical protein